MIHQKFQNKKKSKDNRVILSLQSRNQMALFYPHSRKDKLKLSSHEFI